MMKTTEEVKHDLAVELDDLNGKINRLETYIKSKHPSEENRIKEKEPNNYLVA